jgi:thioredoxin
MEITSQELKQKIESGEKFIVDMYANWCGPCRILGPIIERFSNDLKSEGSDVNVYKFDIESDKELAVSLGVRSIPTIKAFAGGKNVDTKMGVLQETQLRDMVSVL